MTEVVQGEQPSPLDEAQEFAAASMRETENEINLLIPGGSLFDPVYRKLAALGR